MNGMNKEERNYLSKKMNPYLEPMLIDFLATKPSDTLKFMLSWLNDKGIRIKRDMEKKQVKAVHQKYKGEEVKLAASDIPTPTDSDTESEEDDYFDELPEKLMSKVHNRAARMSVSAESFGRFNKKKQFVPKLIDKTEEQKKKIKEIINKSFMFAHLHENDKNTVIDAMQEMRYSRGDYVIRQGDDGDHLYIVESGLLDCTKKFGKETQDKYLLTYGPGEAFGELALLYNAKRAASIKAKTDAVVWGLDRETFNNIVKQAAINKRNRYEKFLSSIKILSDMEDYERAKIADALRPIHYDSDDFVIRQGEEGNSFFFIENGTAVALKTMNDDQEPVEVFAFNPGDYFGELALLKNQKRAASIKATSPLDVVELDRDSFKRLCGPLEDILKRNEERYANFVKG